MYAAVKLENFRGIRQLAVEDLGRVNVLVGPNNAGKTSFLEAVWLLQAPGNPTLATNAGAFRGFNSQLQGQSPAWYGLFPNMDRTASIQIRGQWDGGISESLSISLANEWAKGSQPTPDGTTVAGQVEESISPALSAETLYYDFQQDQEPPVRSSISVGLGRFGVQLHPEITLRQAIFLAARFRSPPEEIASRFTAIQDTTGIAPLIQSLGVLQPGLESLSLGYRSDGGQAQIQLRAHIKGLHTPLPLQLLGEGVGRLMDILLAMSTAPDGLLLIDEVENGLYYQNMDTAWRAIDVASREARVQVFATTHSAECVQAAIRAFDGESAKDFRLYRLEHADEQVRVVTYDHDAAVSAIRFGLEFR